MVQFNIVDTLFNQYKQRFPEATMDNFLTYIQRNYPKQYKWAQQFVDNARDYATGTIDDLKDLEKQTKTNVQQQANQIKNNISNKTAKAQQILENALQKEGLKKAAQATPKTSSTAKNILKGGGRVLGPAVAAAIDVPQTIANAKAPGADWKSVGADILGNLYTVGSIPAMALGVAPGAALIAGGLGWHNVGQQIRDYNVGQQNLNINPVKQLTPEEQQRYNQFVLTGANKLQNQLQNQLQQTQEAIDFYNNFDERMSPDNYSPSPTIQELNMRLPVAPRTGVNTSGNINRPISNLTPLSGQPDASNKNQTGNINMSNQQPIQFQPTNNDMANLMNNIQMLSSYTRGVQQGNQLPDLGVTNEELQAYSNALEQYGKSVANARADVEAYRKAMQRNVRAQGIAGMLDAAGNIIDALTPMQNMYTFNMAGNFVGAPAPTRDSINLGDTLRGVSNRQLENIKNELAINEQLRKTEQDRATAFADLLTAARLSNQTGLPLNVARQMTPENYLNYIKPVQEAQNKAQEIALQGVQDLITGRQQQVADYTKALDTQTLENQGDYQTELLNQQGQNQRAQLNALVTTEVANLNNDTKLKLMQMTGMNQQQLERLRQSDPNAYLRAIGPVLMASAYFTGPAAQAGQTATYQILQNLVTPTGTQQQPAAQSYWAQFNQ